jgi:hypothetical protein
VDDTSSYDSLVVLWLEYKSFLNEQINPHSKQEVNNTLQIQIDAIRSSASAADDIEEVETIILQKRALMNNSKDVLKQIDYLQNWMAWKRHNVTLI